MYGNEANGNIGQLMNPFFFAATIASDYELKALQDVHPD